MLILREVTYAHPDKDVLFSHINLAINKYDKVALVGNNGVGKSTLLNLLAGRIHPPHGQLKTSSVPYYVPQLFGPYQDLSVAQALNIAGKLDALHAILNGELTETNLALLNEDWTIEERCQEALAHWGLHGLDLKRKMETLSGGQKTKVFLAGITIHQPEIVLLDEPTNHLDLQSRELLYEYITTTRHTLVVVSHDRILLNKLNTVYELSPKGITAYGGNYDFYAAQKEAALQALNHDVKDKEKALRKAKEVERETMERKQKLDAKGKKKQQQSGVPTIMLNTLRNNAEKSTSRLKGAHEEKTAAIKDELQELRKSLPGADKMKMGFNQAHLHKGKVLFRATGLNGFFHNRQLWKENLNFEIRSGERIAVKGANGCGKTTLLRMLLGEIKPGSGQLFSVGCAILYIDQDYSLVNDALTVYEQAQQFNSGALQEHEVKTRLARFLFTETFWRKPCRGLSGGEKMRLLLCCITLAEQAPDVIILDEPTNNLDIQNTEILTAAINEYEGALLVVSHDAYFLEQISVERTLLLRAET